MAKSVENDPYAGLNAYWRKFFKKFEEIDDPNMKPSQWKEVHVLAYICKRYEQQYGRKFSVTIKGAPTRSPDMYVVKRIIASLNTTNMRTVKEYIDWVFDKKIIPKKTHFRKVGYFLTEGFANEFFHEKMNKKSGFKRSSGLPAAYIKIAEDLGINISTYGDLAFLQMAVERKPDDTDNPRYVLLANLELLGLNLNALKEME